MRRIVLTLAFAGAVAAEPVAGNGLEKPFAAEAGGQVIDLADATGHAAPLMVDWDGDGLRDLLVGQFDGGKLRIFRNSGEKGAPKFAGFEYFQAAGKDAIVETG